jgi:hypothetical protein
VSVPSWPTWRQRGSWTRHCPQRDGAGGARAADHCALSTSSSGDDGSRGSTSSKCESSCAGCYWVGRWFCASCVNVQQPSSSCGFESAGLS